MRNPLRKIKHFVQRGRRGYSDADLWDFDDYLNGIIAGGLRRFSRDTVGYPDAMKTHEAWQAKLRTLADAIEPKEDFQDGESDQALFERNARESIARTNALKEMAEWWAWLWW